MDENQGDPKQGEAQSQNTDKRGVGRPPVIDKVKLLEALEKYIQESDVPIVSEFAWRNGISRQYLYEIPELADTLKRLITKKEAQLEIGALSGSMNVSMAIFSLKQLGWSDRQDINLLGQLQSKVSGDVSVQSVMKLDDESAALLAANLDAFFPGMHLGKTVNKPEKPAKAKQPKKPEQK